MIQLFTVVSAIFSFTAIIITIYFYVRTARKWRQLLGMSEETRRKLRKAIEEYNQTVDEFLQLQGARAYLRQALDLYEKATTRVISVARVWFVSTKLESILQAMVANTELQVDFCGPAKLNGLFPPLLWRLHSVYVKEKGDPSRIRFWSMRDLPIRFTVSDDDVLIAGAPPSRVMEETIGWQYERGDEAAADFYTAIFVKMLKPHQLAEEVLISELKTQFKTRVTIQTIIDALVTGVFQRQYEAHPQRTTWGRKIEAVEFQTILREWLRSLPNRHPSLVTITGNDIEFK